VCRQPRLAGAAPVRSRNLATGSAADGFAGEGGLDGSQGAEGVERLHEPPIGVGFLRQEDVDLSVEQQQDGSILEIAHRDPLFHSDTRGHAAHVADLHVEQHEGWFDLLNGWHHVNAGSHPMNQVGAAKGGLDVVDKPVGVGGEKDVRHGAKSYTRRGPSPMLGRRVWGINGWGYDAAVLEIHTNRSDDGTQVDLCPEGELDAYSVAQFREAFAELADEPRVIVNLSGVQFMDSAGLGALIGGIRRIRDSEGRVVIYSDREAITKLLHTTGFDRIVPVKDAYAEAIGALDEDPDA
jgi:anti-sigma B factor antagonist